MLRPVLLDSAIPILAVGAESPLKGTCEALLEEVSRADWLVFASSEMIQEYVHHRLRVIKDPAQSVKEAQKLRSMMTILPFDNAVLSIALDLISGPSQIRGRDAVHAATALLHGLDRIITPDRAFDSVPGLTRVDPRDWPGSL